MSEFSYQLGFSVNKPLPPISDPLVDVDFCSSTGAAQTPPTLRFQVSANATSDVEGVFSDCKSIGVGTGTNPTTIVIAAPFGTNADGFTLSHHRDKRQHKRLFDNLWRLGTNKIVHQHDRASWQCSSAHAFKCWLCGSFFKRRHYMHSSSNRNRRVTWRSRPLTMALRRRQARRPSRSHGNRPSGSPRLCGLSRPATGTSRGSGLIIRSRAWPNVSHGHFHWLMDHRRSKSGHVFESNDNAKHS
jgi:hypothetical protein